MEEKMNAVEEDGLQKQELGVFFTINIFGVITYVAPSCETLLGYKANQIIGEEFQGFVHPDDLSDCFKLINQYFSVGIKKATVKCRIRYANGLWRFNTATITPVCNGGGEITSFQGIVTELGSVSTNFDSEQDHMDILVHDLKVFLTPIIGLSDILLSDHDEVSKKEIAEYAQAINSAGHKMLKMINSRLLVVKMENGSLRLTKTPRLVCEVIREIREIFSQLQNPKNVLKISLGGGITDIDVQRSISLDMTTFASLLGNLIQNSIQAVGEKGELLVNISQEDDFYVFAFTNEGEIPQEVSAKMFQKFNTGRIHGNGIGLYSARLVAQAHGGDIFYESLPGATRFLVKIPA